MLFHVASPVHGHGGPNLCGAPCDPDAQYGGLDGAYRAHVEGGADDIVPPVCPNCLAVALIAVGAVCPPWQAAPPPDPSIPAIIVPPERRAELLAEWKRIAAAEQPGRIEVIPTGLPPAAENALRAVLLFYSTLPWRPDQQAEWQRLTGQPDVTTRALCDTVRAVLGDAGGEDPV